MDNKQKRENGNDDGCQPFKRIGSGRYDSLQEQPELQLQREVLEEREKRIAQYRELEEQQKKITKVEIIGLYS